jgi:5-methylcytosine-specific restriction endonuclease McrA
MKCKKCEKEHDGSFGSGIYCSRKCSNSRIFSEESKKRKSEANIKRYIEKGSWGGMLSQLTEEQRRAISLKRKELCNKQLLQSDFNILSVERKRKRVLLEQQYKCFECGIFEWRGQPIQLEIEHKNGIHNDNNRENLIAICPNCHSITKTWRGRNQNKNGNWLSGIEIYTLFKNGLNIRQILLKMNFAAKGANYSKVKRMIERFDRV